MSSTGSCSICKKETIKVTVSCEHCKSFWTCSKKCSKSIFVKDHVKECSNRISQQHTKKSNTIDSDNEDGDYDDDDDDAFEMTYTVNQKVVCQTGSTWRTWKPAVVTQVRCTTYNESGYYCRLTHNGKSIFKLLSEGGDHIRQHDFDLSNHLEVLIHHLLWNAEVDVLDEIIETYKMDMGIIGQKLIFTCAEYNLQEVFEWLVRTKGVDCNCRDEKGRNLLIFALAEKQTEFAKHLIGFRDQLFKAEDDRKLNLLHYLVVADEGKLLRDFLATDDSPITEALIKASALVWSEPALDSADRSPKRSMAVISEWKDVQGRSARDVAVALKRSNLVTILDNFTVQAKLHNTLVTIAYSTTIENRENGLNSLMEFVSKHNVDLRSLTLLKSNTAKLQVIVFDFAAFHVFDKGLLWLHDNWKRDFGVLRTRDFGAHRIALKFIACHFLHGPPDIHFSYTDLSHYVKEFDTDGSAISREEQIADIMGKLRAGFYGFLEDWDGVVDIQLYAQENRKEKYEKSSQLFSNCRNNYHNTYVAYHLNLPRRSYLPQNAYDEPQQFLCAYIDQYIACQRLPQLYPNRLAIFQWMLRTLNQPLPPLHLFVEFGQLHLLKWACSEGGLVDLSANIASNAGLHAHCEALLVFDTIDVSRLTVGECLCILTASLDQLPIFQWVFREHLPNKSLTVGAEGLNLLQLGASLGSYSVVKWLVANKLLDPVQQSGSGLNSLHLAVRNSHVPVSMYLLTVVPLDLLDVHGHDVLHYADQSTEQCDSRLRGWAALRHKEKLFIALYSAAKDGNLSFPEWLVHLQALDFLDAFCDKPRIDFFAGTAFNSYILMEKLGELFTQSPDYDVNFDFEECVILLAATVQCVEFFQHLKDRLDQEIKLDNFKCNINACLNLIDLLSVWAAQHNKHKVVQFLAVWRADLTCDKDVEEQMTEECKNFERLFLNGASVEAVEQSVQRQRNLLAKMAPPHKYFFSFENFHHEGHRIGADSATYRDMCTFVEHVINEKYLHLLTWMLGFVPCTATFLTEALLHAVRTDSLEAAKLVLARFQSGELAATKTIKTTESPSETSESCPVPSRAKTPIDSAIVKAMVRCCGEQYESDFTKKRVRPGLFHYLLGFVEGREVENVSQCVYACVMSLVFCDNEDNWALLRFMLSRPDLFHTNARFHRKFLSEDCTDATDAADLVLVEDIVSSNLFRYYNFGAVSTGAELWIESNQLSGQSAHILCLLGLLHRHHWHIGKHEAKVMECFDRRIEEGGCSTRAAVELLKYFAENFGFNIQKFVPERRNRVLTDYDRSALTLLAQIKTEQAERWKLSDLLSKNATNKALLELVQRENHQQHFTSAKQAKGRSLLHIAALHNRVDVMRWLVADYHMDVLAVDSAGDSVLLLAQKAGATDTELFVVRLLASRKVAAFCARHFYRRRFLKHKRRAIAAVTVIQSKCRQVRVWRQYGPFLQARLQSLERFRGIWGQVIALMDASKLASGESLGQSWASIKLQHDMLAVDESAEVFDMESVLGEVLASNGLEESSQLEETNDHQERAVKVTHNCGMPTTVSSVSKPLDTVDLSQSALKWLEGADQRYKAMFQNRVAQLAEGDRSYALSKRLKGCEYAVYETKLDAGQRILWTQFRRGGATSVLVWFVSKHDNVSRLVKQIDNSYARLSRQPDVSVAAPAEESVELRDDDILLDPIGNCPLKIYTTNRGDIPLLTTTGWTPPLRLGVKQQEIQDVSGTVLLLGRSGTGKTVCLSDRMTRDRECMRVTQGVVCNQLFVSRSKKLCEFVRAYQTKSCTSLSDLDHTDFFTLDHFVSRMEKAVNNNSNESSVLKAYMTSRRVDFQRFRFLMAAAVKKSKLEAVVVWTQIRSFLKGSVEAVLQGSPLTLEQYLSKAVMGQDRCRLLPEQRRRAFAVYSEYAEVLGKEGLWDDADRVLDLLTRSKLEPLSACNGKGADYHKVYVDEVQDNTQAEIVLYFLAGGMNTQSLFLAGDPAQSVVEGVDFRFEEVRSIVYKLSGGKESISRPVKLTTNYRSHSGIMDCAAAILDKMFRMFPDAASILPRDAGLFKGPRPAYCSVFAEGSLLSLLRQSERIVVICPDDRVQRAEELLSESGLVNSVWGIRAAKGLEFQDIVLFDFFSSVPTTDHKAWRSLLSEELTDNKVQNFPQIESQLKLLYTAITRSCNRLLFVESCNTSLCSVFFRWLSVRSLAEPFAPSVGGEAREFMTSDEWRARGIELAVSAEGSDAVLFLQRAVRCFQLAGDSALRSRASVHLELEEFRHKFMQQQQSGSRSGGAGGSVAAQLRPKDELDLAALVCRAIRANLNGEAREICELVREAVCEPKYFGTYLL